MTYTSIADFDLALSTAREAFDFGKTRDKKWRRRQLQQLWWMLEDNKQKIHDALYQDMHKHRLESISIETNLTQIEALRYISNLDKWTADERPARLNPLNWLSGATVRKEPKGVVLILGPWNFPLMLLFKPVIAAIAAGNAVIVKPSDCATHTERLIVDMVTQYLDPDAIRCVTAGPKEMEHILAQRYAHVFFTGSTSVGKIIAAAAAKYLTPVTLELGGLNPAIVCPSANIPVCAKRIASSKTTNAGQICLSVNHVLVDPSVKADLVNHLIRSFDRFMGGRHERLDFYTSIINEKNFDRLNRMLLESSGEIVYGGYRDRASLFFGPTIVVGVARDDSLLSDEIFGPILVIVEATLPQAIAFAKTCPTPLCLYPFTRSQAEKDMILANVPSGGVTFNDWLVHMTTFDTPFGGFGDSGLGRYQGPYGVAEFSHLRTTAEVPAWIEMFMWMKYPPYTDANARMIEIGTGIKAPFDRDGVYHRGLWWWTQVIICTTAAVYVGQTLLLLIQ